MASSDRKIHLLELATGKDLRQFSLGPTGNFNSFAFSPDGRLLAAGATDGIVHVWDVTTGREHVPAERPFFVGFLPDGKTVMTAGLERGLHFWEATTGKERPQGKSQRIDVPWPRNLVLADNGKIVATVGHKDRAVRVWEVATGRELHRLPHMEDIGSVALSPDGKLLVCKNAESTNLFFWDVSTGQPRGTLQAPPNSFPLTFSPDGKIVALTDGLSIFLWDTAEMKALRDWPADTRAVGHLAFSADGRCLASVGESNKIRIWEVVTGKKLREIPLEPKDRSAPDRIEALAFSPDGKTLVSGDLQGTISFWDADTGRLRRQVKGHESDVSRVVFSPDGTLLASLSFGDTTALIWDVNALLESK